MTVVAAEHTARILEGPPIAEAIRATVREDLADILARRGSLPGIRVFLVGDDAPSRVYAGRILRNAAGVGVHGELVELPSSTTTLELGRRLEAASADPDVGGIIVQMPLPASHPGPRRGRRARPRQGHRRHPPIQRRPAGAGSRRSPTVVRRGRGRDPAPVRVRHRRADMPWSSVAATWWASPPSCCCCATTPPSRSATGKTRDLAAEVARADILSWSLPAVRAGARVDAPTRRHSSSTAASTWWTVPSWATSTGRRPSRRRRALTPVPGGVGPVTNAVLLRHFVAAVRSANALTRAATDAGS